MTTPVQYTGNIKPFFELPITGQQGSWMPNQVRDRTDADATLLIASGVFSKSYGNVPDANADATDGIVGLTGAQVAALAPVAVPGLFAGSSTYATINYAALQYALNQAANSVGGAGGIYGPGRYYFNDQFTIQSDYMLYLGAGVELFMAAGTNKNCFKNANFNATDGSSWIAISSLVTADGITCAATTTAPHGLTTGKVMHTMGAVQDDFNGIVEITVTGASTFTYTRDLATGGNFTGTATFLSAVGITGTMNSASALITGMSTVVGISPGMFVAITSGAGAFIGMARVDTIDSASQIKVFGAIGNSTNVCTFNFSFPLQCCPADRRIRIIGPGRINHNQTNQTTGDVETNTAIWFRNVGDVTVSDFQVLDSFTSVVAQGVYSSIFEKIRVQGAARLQSNGIRAADHCARNVTIRDISGTTRDDFVSVVQKQYFQYLDAGTPIGPITDLTIQNINPSGCLSAVKLLPNPGCVFDNVVVDNVKGRSSITNFISAPCYDFANTGAYAVGAIGTITNLKLSKIQHDKNPTATLANVTAHATDMSIVDSHATSLTTGRLVNQSASSVITALRLENIMLSGNGATTGMVIAGSMLDLEVSNLRAKSMGAVISYSGGAANGANIKAVNTQLDACASLLALASVTGVTLSAVNADFINYTGNWVQSNGTSQIFARLVNCEIAQPNAFGGTWSNSNAYWSDSQSDSLTSAATVTPNMLRRKNKSLIIGQNVTIANPSNPHALGAGSNATELTLVLAQGASGPFTVAFGGNYIFPAALGIASSANLTAVCRFVYDGLNKWICTNTPVWV